MASMIGIGTCRNIAEHQEHVPGCVPAEHRNTENPPLKGGGIFDVPLVPVSEIAPAPGGLSQLPDQCIDGQEFRFLGYADYRRKDGVSTQVARWWTSCPTCGVGFECFTSAKFDATKFRRRCDEHRRPGSPVRREQQRREQVSRKRQAASQHLGDDP